MTIFSSENRQSCVVAPISLVEGCRCLESRKFARAFSRSNALRKVCWQLGMKHLPKFLGPRYREARIVPPVTVEELALSEDTDRA